MKQQEENRGPGARKTRLERHLNANAEAERRNFGKKTPPSRSARSGVRARGEPRR